MSRGKIMKYSALLAIRCTYEIKNPVHRIGHSRPALHCILMPVAKTHKTPQMINLQGFAVLFVVLLRKERDSNPRNLSVQRFSRPPQSTTLPSLLVSKTGAKVDGLFELCKFFISFLFTFFVFHSSISDYQTHKKNPIPTTMHRNRI